jgi:hypothetical protein
LGDLTLPLLVIAAFAAFACYEVWQAVHHAPTISEQVWRFSKAWPPIGFLVGLGAGLLLGHLFTTG